MKILYIDTSTDYLYTGIVSNNILITEIKKSFNHDLSKYALYEISKMFEDNNLTPNDIDKIIVVDGPGSYTGIRVGMTIAKIYAWALKKQITSISSLDAMQVSTDFDGLLIPVIDARRGYAYGAIYQNNLELLPKQYIKLTDLQNKIKEMNKKYIFISNNNLKLDNLKSYNPDILKIVNTYQNKANVNPHMIEPNYLKLTEAEENLQGIKHDN